MASTSSVYGANKEMPFVETDKADTQLDTPRQESQRVDGARLCPLLGPPPRPVLHGLRALGTPRPRLLQVRRRDPRRAADRCLQPRRHVPRLHPRGHRSGDPDAGGCGTPRSENPAEIPDYDSLSPVAPFRVVNIGNSDKVQLLDFIDAIEDALGVQAIRNYMPMQPGDVHATWAGRLLRG